MLKRIIVLLGETPASVTARQYAFRLTRAEGAKIAGIAGIDIAFIESPMIGGLGTTSYKSHMEETLKAQAASAHGRLHELYESECRAHGVSFEWIDFTGDPLDSIRRAAEGADLLVTGHDTAFHGNIREWLPDMLADLLRAAPRPLIVTGEADHGDGDVMIAYDGSLPAMRSVQLFALLGLWSRRRVSLVAIHADKQTADKLAQGALRYLRGHGCEVVLVPVTTRAAPAEILRIEAADRGIGTLVMGAYGHRGLRERLFGSTTTNLVEDPPCALFVYH